MPPTKVIKRHSFPTTYYQEMIKWLEENIQENFHSNGEKYNMSSVGQFVEWRSKDRLSWVLRVAGNPPMCYVEIKDDQKEILFLLRWQ